MIRTAPRQSTPALSAAAAAALFLAASLTPEAAFAQQAGAPAGQGQSQGQGQSGNSSPNGGNTSPNAGQPGGGQNVGAPTAGQTGGGPVGSTVGGGTVSGQQAPGTTGGTQSLPLTKANDSPNFDLARTIEQALASSSSIQIAQKQVKIDDRRVDLADAENRPNITASGSATKFDARTKISLGGSSPIQVLDDHTEQTSIGLTQKIDLFGQVRAAHSQARLQQLADKANLAQETQSRALQAKTIYFNLLRAQHQVQVAQSALRDAQTQEAISRRLYENQVGQKIDLLRAQTNVAQAQQNLTAAQNNQDVARASFNDLVGRPLSAPVVAQDVPGVSVGVDIQPSNGVVGSAPQENLPTFTPFTVPATEINSIQLDQSIAQAQNQRPEVIQNAALVRASEVGVRIAREGMQPSLSFSASGNYYPSPSFSFPRQRTAAFTISASIPLYDGGRTRDEVSEAHLRADQARTALESSKSDVALQVQQAYLNLVTAARQIDAANAALTQAIAARQLAQVRYEGQVGLFLEVTDAQAALVRAEGDQVNAVYNYMTARAQFENALGVPALQQTNTIRVGETGTIPTTPGNNNAPATPPKTTGPTTNDATPR